MKVRTMLLLAVLFASCSKEESLEPTDNPGTVNNGDRLKGNYTFLYMQAHTEGTVEVTDGRDTEKMVSISNYVTKDNVGTVVIDASKFSAIAMGYSVDTTVKGYYYINGVLDDTIESDFQFAAPPLNSVSPYTLKGIDSLIFTGGIVSIPSGGGGTASPESRCRYAFSGDTLTLYQGYYNRTTSTQQGLKITQTDVATMMLKLLKKN
jgi:hypothetical protein